MSGAMRVVVVGGTGNISSALVAALTAAGHEVAVFVRGKRTSPLPLPDGVRVIHGDRNDREAFELTMREEAFDVAFDLICWGPEDAESDVRAFVEVGHFFQTSTVCTIGGPLAELPATEKTELRPIGPYGEAKASADEVFLTAHRNSGFPVTVIKPSHTWGPAMPVPRQLGFDPHWIDRLRAGKPLLIGGDGRQRWQLCHSEDAVQAYVGLIGHEDAIGETYIVTAPEPISWIDYHQQIADALGAELNLLPAPAEDLIRLWPETTAMLAEQSQWDQWYDVGKLLAAVPTFESRLTLGDRIAENLTWIEAHPHPSLPLPSEVPDREDEVIAELGLG
jgi:nucleoside-diphosphate-sugar epimerase